MTDEARKVFQEVLEISDDMIFRRKISDTELEIVHKITELVFQQIGVSFDDFPQRLKNLASILINHTVYMYGTDQITLVRVATRQMMTLILTAREYERR